MYLTATVHITPSSQVTMGHSQRRTEKSEGERLFREWEGKRWGGEGGEERQGRGRGREKRGG